MPFSETLNRYFRGDKVILLIMIFLALFSLYAVSSSTDMLASQIKHMVLCFGGMIVFYHIDYRFLSGLSFLFLLIALALVLLTLFVGDNPRSLQIGRIDIQTFYFVGFLVIFFIAKFLAVRLNKDKELNYKELFFVIAIIGLFGALIAKSNFSTAAIFALSCFVVLFVGNISYKHILIILVVGIVGVGVYFGSGYGRSDTGKGRIEKYQLARNFDQRPATKEEVDYIRQMVLAEAAIARSAWIPAGPGQGVIKNYLAEKDTDYVYATVVEEVGFIGGAVILFLYLILFYRAMQIARKSNGYFGRLLAVGIGFWITCQALLHIAVNCLLVPATGQTLPMISRGGASLLFTGIMMGILLNISKNQENIKYDF